MEAEVRDSFKNTLLKKYLTNQSSSIYNQIQFKELTPINKDPQSNMSQLGKALAKAK